MTTGVAELLSSEPIPILTYLAWHLAISARASYPRVGKAPSHGAEEFRAINELVVVTEQLRSLSLDCPRYPDTMLLDALRKTAEVEGSATILEWSLEKAMEDCERA